MSRPGLKNMLFGFLWAAGAIVIVLATDRLFYIALVIGGGQFIIGIIQFLLYSVKSSEKKAQLHDAKGLNCLYRSMVSVAIVDGELAQNEVELIQSIFRKVTGSEVTSDEIASAAVAIGKNLDGFLKDIKKYAELADADMKALTIRACVYVSAIDGSVSDDEKKHLYRLSKILGHSHQDIDIQLHEALAQA